MGYRCNNRSCNYSNNNCANNTIDWEEFFKLAGTYDDANDGVKEVLAEAAEHLCCAMNKLCEVQEKLDQSNEIWMQMEQWLDANYAYRYNCCKTIRCGLAEAKEEAKQLVLEVKQHTTDACCGIEKAKEGTNKVRKLSNEVAKRGFPRRR